jgi:hypothetical protein
MPPPLLRSLAALSDPHVSTKKMERRWDAAKDIVKKQYSLDEKNPRFWALTTGIVKKMSGIKENMTFKQYLGAYAPDRLEAVKKAGFKVSVEYDDADWTATGKLGTNTSTGKKVEVAEYMHRKDGVEHRIWMDTAGNVYEDS